MSLTRVDLPEPDTPVTATKHAEREATRRRRCRLCSRAPCTVSRRLRSIGAAHRRDRDRAAGRRGTAPVSESSVASRSSTGPETHDLAAVLAGARADVDDPVGDPDGVLVVLDDDQGVAQVAQPDQGLDQPVVVALVQADGRLVEHVEHADQAGADLGGQPDALGLAAGQGGRGAVQREVVQADVDQEPQPLVDLLEHPLGDLRLAVGRASARRRNSRAARRSASRRPRRSDSRPADGDGERRPA